ncbi:MAG TPA: hypothetical protein VHF47_14765 [Acidimicrobiales bacterium]|nr:hypothetical protein [Acidimicrobiales bacterium]
MVRRSFRIGLRLGLLTGVVAAVVKTVQARRDSRGREEEAPPAWPPTAEPTQEAAPTPDHPQSTLSAEPEVPSLQTEDATPAPVRKSAAKKATTKKAPATKKAAGRKAAAPAAWVEPTGSVCPPSHPVKAKLSSKLFHLPGMFAYARTVPDRCYRSEADAEADGLTRAKR